MVFAGAVFSLISQAQAQITLSCKVAPLVAIQFEPVMAEWTLVNNTGQILELGSANANCQVGFDIYDASGLSMPARSKRPLVRRIRIQPTQSVVMTNWIEQAYDLRKTGPYTVQARVEWNGRIFLSNKIFMDVWPGSEIDRVVTGIPGKSGAQRTFILLTVNRDKQDILFLRIDDEREGVCYGVYELGRLLRMGAGAPSLKTDNAGQVHILHRSGPSQYIYSIYTPDGKLKDRRPYTGDYTRIRMEADGIGQINVTGTLAPKEELVTPLPELPIRRK